MKIRRTLFCFLCAVVLATSGCEKPPEFGRVTGTVTMNGKPLDEVRVLFLPDPESNNQGAHSVCITDDAGNYDLIYSKDIEIHGAIVGWHRGVVEDIAAENSRDRVRAIRIPAAYSSSAKTPLRFEVQPDEQTIDIKIDR